MGGKPELKLRPVGPKDVELGLGFGNTQLLQPLFASRLVFFCRLLNPPCPVFCEASGFLVPMARNLTDTPHLHPLFLHGSSNRQSGEGPSECLGHGHAYRGGPEAPHRELPLMA